MAIFVATVIVKCNSLDEAETVLAERLAPNEDYGFPYFISHTPVVGA